jgi:hypothetical protein
MNLLLQSTELTFQLLDLDNSLPINKHEPHNHFTTSSTEGSRPVFPSSSQPPIPWLQVSKESLKFKISSLALSITDQLVPALIITSTWYPYDLESRQPSSVALRAPPKSEEFPKAAQIVPNQRHAQALVCATVDSLDETWSAAEKANSTRLLPPLSRTSFSATWHVPLRYFESSAALGQKRSDKIPSVSKWCTVRKFEPNCEIGIREFEVLRRSKCWSAWEFRLPEGHVHC